MDTVNFTIRLNREAKKDAERRFSDPFYSPENQSELIRRAADIAEGKNLVIRDMV